MPPSRYYAQIVDKQRAAFHSVLSLMSILETHEIVMPEFVVLREQLARAIEGLNLVVNDFGSVALQFSIPTPPHWPPTDDHRKMLSQLASRVSAASIALTGVVWDLRVEAQNYLLGGVFPGRRIRPRTPGDPSVRVTTIPPRSD